jgi:WD40 repeat protein
VVYASKPDLRRLYDNPGKRTHQPHFSAVLALSFCPLAEDLFATGSLDGDLRLYSIRAMQPLMAIQDIHDSVLALAFSPSKPSVLAAACASGQLFFFNLLEEDKVLEFGDNKEANLALAWNKAHPELLAVCIEGGAVTVYELADDLWQCQPDEKARLDAMIK